MDGQMKCRLVVKQGTQPAQDYELSQAEVTIGRDPTCEISISQTSVSRRHARLSRKGDRYYVEDLGSSNGTTLNGKFVQGATPLNTGDQIGLGAEVTLVFEDPAQKSVFHRPPSMKFSRQSLNKITPPQPARPLPSWSSLYPAQRRKPTGSRKIRSALDDWMITTS
jgi:pSer/pThr/pTyr-binding forkhead associated (FHA) protein